MEAIARHLFIRASSNVNPSLAPSSPDKRSVASSNTTHATPNQNVGANDSDSVLDSIELLTNISVTSKPRFLPRKPRSLLFSKHHPQWMVTSTLDGSLQSWSLPKKAIELPSLHLPSHLNESVFAEDMCMTARGGHLALVMAEFNSNPNEASSGTDSFQGAKNRILLAPLVNNQISSPTIVEPSFSVHSKPISSIVAYYDGPSDRSLLLTGGNDRALVLWDIDETNLGKAEVREVHRRHTSGVHTICQLPQSRNVWTGGPDMRLIGFSMSKSQPLFEQKLDGRISHILSNSEHPNCLLVAQSKQSDQFRIVDTRNPNENCPLFGVPEISNTTRYLKPSWHHAGNLIACGTSNPVSRSSGINLWDIRYVSRTSSPLQMVGAQPDRRYLNAEFHPSENLLVALTTDASLYFIDYTLA